MPELDRTRCLVKLSVGEAHEFELHAPRCTEIDPRLAKTVTGALRRFAHDFDIVRSEMFESRIEVVNIEGDMVPTNVTVARKRALTVDRFVLKHLKVRTKPTPIEAEFAHDRARVHSKVGHHPLIIAFEGSERVDPFATDNVHEEALGLINIRHSYADVLDSSEPGQTL